MIRTLGSRIRKLFFIVLIIGQWSLLQAGSVTATVDESEIVEGNSVLLTLTVVGEQSDKLPDISEINGIPVESSSRNFGSSFTSINGQNKMEHTQSLTLEFKPDGNMTIPSFQVKVDGKIEATEPINLTLVKAKVGLPNSDEKFSLDIKLNKSKAYLGEPIIATVLFKQRRNIDVMDIQYEQPAFKDFFSKVIGQQKNYNKGEYAFLELQYLLIPKHDGNLTLEPARAKVAERVRQKQFGGWFSDVPQWSNLTSPSLILEVIKPSKAHDVVGNFKLNEHIDSQKVEVNKPVNLQIEITGEGSLDDFEGLKFELDGVTIYSDDAKVESKLVGEKVESHYVKSFVFIADHDFTIPSKTIRVYDYRTDEVKLLTTKSYDIKVNGAKQAMVQPMVYTKNSRENNTTNNTISSTTLVNTLPSIVALFLAFVLGVVVTLLLKYLPTLVLSKWRMKKFGFNYDEALQVLYPKMSQSPDVEAMVRQLYAIKQGDKSIQIDKEVLKAMLKHYQ